MGGVTVTFCDVGLLGGAGFQRPRGFGVELSGRALIYHVQSPGFHPNTRTTNKQKDEGTKVMSTCPGGQH